MIFAGNWLLCAVLCFVPLIAVFVCAKILVKEFCWWKGLICLALGFVAVAPIAGMQWLFENNNFIAAKTTGAVLLSALILNGLIEELIRTAVLFATPLTAKSQFGAFVTGVLSGMSLGCLEIFVYLGTGWETQLLRLASVMGIQIPCSVLCSLFVYSVKNKKLYVTPILLAVVLHGLYSYFAGYYSFMKYFCVVVIVVAAVECRLRYVKMKRGREELLEDLERSEKEVDKNS